MSNSKHFDKIAVVGVILAVAFTLWFIFGAKSVLTPMSETLTEYVDEKELSKVISRADATITLDGEDITVEGHGAVGSFGNVTINDGGVYVISGSLTDGNIDVNAGSSDVVYIVLDGADITCPDDAALLVENAKAVYVYTTAGSSNSMENKADMESSVEVVAAGREGCVYARDDVIFAGEGALEIISNYGNAVVQGDNEDALVFESGTVNITSVAKGIKSDGTIDISGGEVNIVAEDDGIHADGDVTLTAGDVTVSSADDGVHSDTTVYLNGTNVKVEKAYEGVEAPVIEMNGGDVCITSSDDGFNGNGSGAEDSLVTINEGNLTILNSTGMDADGLDSNGDIVINGGYIYVSLTGGGTNNAIDFGSENGGTCTINGGTVIAAGGSGMLESISSESAQGSITMVYDSTYEANTKVTVTDSDGKELISQVIDDSMSAVTLSAPGMEAGSTYTITTGDDAEEITMDTVSYSNTELTGMGGFGRGGMENGGDLQKNFGGQNDGDFQKGKDFQNGGGRGGMGGGRGMKPQMDKNASGDSAPRMDGNSQAEGGMPQMDGSSQSKGEMPQMDGNMAGGKMPGGDEWDMDNAGTVKTWYTPTATDWIWVVSATAVLLAAIGFAIFFKRRKR